MRRRKLPPSPDQPYRVLHNPFPEAEVGADEGQRDGDAEPESDQSEDRQEGQGSRRAVSPQHEVQQQGDSEHDPEEMHV